MIRKAKFSNFYSFNQEVELDFTTKKKKTYDYYNSKSGDQVTKIAGFIGSNASGKTNVMRFFSFLSYFVCRKIDEESSLITEIAYKSFFNNKEISNFAVEFENKDYIFFYNFSLKENIILEESLSLKKIAKGAKKNVVFSRKINDAVKINNDYFGNLSIDILPKIREDLSFITFIKKSPYSIDIINCVYDYFLGFKTNITEKGTLYNMPHQIKALKAYLDDNDLKVEMEKFITHFDVGLSGFEIVKETDEKGVSISVSGVHSAEVKNNKLSFMYESQGTKALFFIMSNILNALKYNNIVIIDELESGFHPEALNKLIAYFIDENMDKSAQLIFSSHSLGFMNKLDMHQMYLVEKNNKSESYAYRLNTVKNIRSDENLLAKYMTGIYGAFPKIRV